ncbi:Fungalysin/Thermolysin Extracellular metalloproteinase 5 [Entomortierella beljakovae]|nr:Fungalysin/Thermolysin Extracellular metalloproteinase 5 [Entomortierella beljakovae]
MKFSKTQSYSLLTAMLAVAATAHRARVRPFGPELSHQQYHTSSLTSTPGFATDDTVFFKGSPANPTKAATDFVEKVLTTSDFIVKNSYTTKRNGVTHVYLRQVIDGLEVVNGDININVDRNGNVISYGDSFYKIQNDESLSISDWIKKEGEAEVPKPAPKADLSPQDALTSFARFLGITIPHPEEMEITTTHSLTSDKPEIVMNNCPLTADGKVPVNQAYIQTEEGKLELVYDFQVKMKESDNWFHTQVSAETGSILQVVDWVSDATYNVYPMGINDPNEGNRKLLVNPEHKEASPLGWNRQSQNKNFTTTIGNNVYAGENRRNGDDWENNPRPQAKVRKNGDLVFDFELNLEKDPVTYVDAAVTNLFYWNNQVHDVFYHYGFTEPAGNFQENNFGKGGLDGDAVIANAQDGSGYNNANFATPPDGQKGQMRMYVWDITEVARDGDLESGIIIHEYAHGISTRLTGGPANSGCLPWGEAGGMGEGWGDFFATMFRQNATHNWSSEFDMGSYATGGQGIRRFPYSTSFETNPETFKIMDKKEYWEVHAKGEVWAEMLFEVYNALHLRLPFTDNWYTEDIEKYANTLVLQLVVDGMKLQPCFPSFTQARDAIILAEKLLTNGVYHCDIWRAFAKRGLGRRARAIGANAPLGGLRFESFSMPDDCE